MEGQPVVILAASDFAALQKAQADAQKLAAVERLCDLWGTGTIHGLQQWTYDELARALGRKEDASP